MFENIYKKVDEIKDCDSHELLNLYDIELVYDEYTSESRKALLIPDEKILFISTQLSEQEENCVILHEIGHYLFDKRHRLSNKIAEENNANTFMCLYLVKNDIWEYEYFDRYLIDCGVPIKVAKQFNEKVYQYKFKNKYDLVY